MSRNREGTASSRRERATPAISDIAPEIPPTAGEQRETRPLELPVASDFGRVSGPTDDDIRVRAYLRYQERGCTDGMADDDWFAAERELRARS